MNSATSAIVIDVTESISVIRFNRPETRNPLSFSTLTELKDSISELTARTAIESIILTGSGDVFAAGADIRELAQLDRHGALTFAQRGQQLFQMIADARQLTIAAIDGYCMGGGLDLALACDLRIASPRSVFAHPGARLGIITGWGGTQRLPRLIGRAGALEMLATARSISSQQAFELGLITRIAQDPLPEAFAIARKKASRANT